MKKKHLGQPALFNVRTSIRLLVYAAALSCMLSGTLLAFSHSEAPTKASRTNLTFAERVAYQRAIEEVYWRHRIWPRSGGERSGFQAIAGCGDVAGPVGKQSRRLSAHVTNAGGLLATPAYC